MKFVYDRVGKITLENLSEDVLAFCGNRLVCEILKKEHTKEVQVKHRKKYYMQGAYSYCRNK